MPTKGKWAAVFIRDEFIPRITLGLSHSAMGAKLHVPFQQIQKYEFGKNRLSAARSFEICEALGVSLSSIFERELKA
jgi:transcriptional regulator with XRE-family HTH domain